ncbi:MULTISPECIES: hypothetical protein [unclassified Streptomyces]|uniref:hypothetical protein n=1 Tax=unclassified Streptomyces TaxID=2593676 RepID=UPI0038297464
MDEPGHGQVFDLTEAYVPAGECYYDDPKHPAFTWQYFDRWSGGVPVLHAFHGDDKTPAHGGRRITDGEWVRITDAPKFSERMAALGRVGG